MSAHWPLVPLSPEAVAALSAARASESEALDAVVLRLLREQRGNPRPTSGRDIERSAAAGCAFEYELLGKVARAVNASAAMVAILRELQARDATFLERLARRVTSRSRNHVARSRLLVYPHRPDLAEKYTREIVPGWFVGTNIANREKRMLIVEACDVAGLVLGRDLKLGAWATGGS